MLAKSLLSLLVLQLAMAAPAAEPGVKHSDLSARAPERNTKCLYKLILGADVWIPNMKYLDAAGNTATKVIAGPGEVVITGDTFPTDGRVVGYRVAGEAQERYTKCEFGRRDPNVADMTDGILAFVIAPSAEGKQEIFAAGSMMKCDPNFTW